MAKVKVTRKTTARTQPATRPARSSDSNYIDRIETEIKSNQSTLSLVLGILIVIVLGVLVFNYFTRNKNLPATQEASTETQEQAGDVSPDNLPGKYTVKEGDTLFTIADKYYQDGYKYSELVKANNLPNENTIEVGQVLDIPKLDTNVAQSSASPSSSDMAMASPTDNPTDSPAPTQQAQAQAAPANQAQTAPTSSADNGTGGGDTTVWGPNIHTDTYTVVEGDWLSTIAARAYGDIMAYQKIAQANNIADPNVIEPGTVLKIPR